MSEAKSSEQHLDISHSIFFFQQHGYPTSYPLINILWKWWWTWLIEVLCLRGTGVEENTDVVPGDGLETSKLMQLCFWNYVGGWFVQRRDLQIVQMKLSVSFYVFFCVGNNNSGASSWLQLNLVWSIIRSRHSCNMQDSWRLLKSWSVLLCISWLLAKCRWWWRSSSSSYAAAINAYADPPDLLMHMSTMIDRLVGSVAQK